MNNIFEIVPGLLYFRALISAGRDPEMAYVMASRQVQADRAVQAQFEKVRNDLRELAVEAAATGKVIAMFSEFTNGARG